MYVSTSALRYARVRRMLCGVVPFALAMLSVVATPLCGQGQGIVRDRGIIQKITSRSDHLELTDKTSQIITLGTRIPRIQVNNPDILSVTPLSATQVQITGKKVGVTTINLWDENDNVYTIDVTILGDAQELELALRTQFPNSSIRVYKYTNSLVLKGFVDRPDYISQIQSIAEDYAPKVINNISVGGVHDIMLKVKVMEVSRTKLREFGIDFDFISSGDFVSSFVGDIAGTVSETFRVGITNNADEFTAFLSALEQHDLAKTLAEPVLTTVSGRPAKFLVGGEFPVLIPQSLGTVSIDFKDFGTRVDFLPIVLGNGNIRLEVRPKVSELDPAASIVINGATVPGLRVREIDTGVEMKAGQTLALAGLIQQRVEAQVRGLPVISKVPYLGVPFRRVREEINEVELLILVTPEFVDAMDPHQVPPCGPGMYTTSPSTHELYLHGYLEVPTCPDGTCGPMNWAPGGMVAPDGSAVIMSPEGQDMPLYEPVPPGVNGSQGILPEAPGTSPAAPPDPAQDSAYNRLPVAPVNVPAVDATPYRYERTPTYIRGDSYMPADEPPGPIGPTGYDVQE